jgi:hypothetical protein
LPFIARSLVPFDVLMKREFRGPLHTGLQADLGVSYAVVPQWQIVLGFVTTYNNCRVTDGEITDYEVDGTSRIWSLDNTDITIYPGEERANHSYYGFKIGVRYVPGRKE